MTATTEAAAPAVPTLATALALVVDLLEVLEEVDPDTRLQLYQPAVLQLASPCAALRSRVCFPIRLLPPPQSCLTLLVQEDRNYDSHERCLPKCFF